MSIAHQIKQLPPFYKAAKFSFWIIHVKTQTGINKFSSFIIRFIRMS